MRVSAIAMIVAALIGAHVAQAATTDCARVPKLVTDYVSQQTGWHLRTTDDLGEERSLWSQGHLGQCPGFISLHLDAGSSGTYAVALIRQMDNALHERLEIRHFTGHTASVLPLNKDWENVGPLVIFKAKPGIYTDIETSRKVTLHFDGIIFEKMEAMDHLYYMDNDHVADVMLSD